MQVSAYAARTAPRYTSYPTARAFDGAVTPAVFEGWLAALPPATDVSAYVHVPYCRELCHYCGCNTFAAARDGVLSAYAGALRAEIDLVAQATPARRIREIHWGGGTPNILSPAEFEQIVLRLGDQFDLSAVGEHAIEIDPRALTHDQAMMYASLGVTRASLGVQDLNDHVQRAIGRIQPVSVVARAAGQLRDSGISALNFDLMYGLPHQTVHDVRTTVREALRLAPDRVAMFGYAHVPWFKARQRLIPSDALPDESARLQQADAAREELLYAGYRAIGFDHYALPQDPLARAARHGALRRNFQGFVDDDCPALIGFGPSAISTLPQGYAQNAAHPTAWAQSILRGEFSTVRGHALTTEDTERRSIIESLLCRFSVDLAPFGGAKRFASEVRAMESMAGDGLVRWDGDSLVILPEARRFARVVAAVFDVYRPKDSTAHSGVS